MRPFSRVSAAVFACMLLLAPARAQRLPAGLPSVPAVPGLAATTRGLIDADLAAPVLPGALKDLRRQRIDALLRREARRVDVDAHGDPVLRREYLAVAPDPQALEALRRAGFDVVRRADEGVELGLDTMVLRDTRDRAATRAMRDLRAAAPGVEFAYQHVYLPAGTASPGAAGAMLPSTGGPVRIGLIDGGVGTLPALAGLRVERHGCDGRSVADAHANAVATRLAGGLHGTLYAADLWCGDRVGRATLGLVQALAWMARERVPVVNVSLVGPDNPVLARAVQALVARGHVVVAAVGNDGPAAPPLYPAAYAGVLGVSGVDAKLRALAEAASGPQVDFSASGIVDSRTRGTSFAAPIVARLAASLTPAPAPDAIRRVQLGLAQHARDLGTPGRDPRYGDGYLTAF